MSKESAMQGLAALTGAPVPTAPPNPSLLTGGMNAQNQTPQNKTNPTQNDAGSETPSEGDGASEAASGAAEGALSSTQFAVLKKRETKLFQEREQLKKELEAFTPKKSQAEALIAKAQKFEELKKTDVVGALKEIGLTDTEIFNLMATQAEKRDPTPAEQAQAVIDKFQADEAAKVQKAQSERDQKIISGFKAKLPELRTKDPEKYEFCNFYEAEADEIAFNLVKEAALDPEEPTNISPEEAMQEVEEFYENRDKLMSKLKKRQPAVEMPGTAKAAAELKPAAVQPGKPAPAKAAPATPPVSRETLDQKKARLIERLRNGG